jgi:hypothetical protein
LFYLSILLFSDSYVIFFREFYFLPFSAHAQTNAIYVTLLSLLQWVFLSNYMNFFICSFLLSCTGPKFHYALLKA